MPQDIHSALKTEVVSSVLDGGLDAKLVKLQSGKNDVGHSLHVTSNSYRTSGIQIADLLDYLGLKPVLCPFQMGRQSYCNWAAEDFDLNGFITSFNQSYQDISEAERRLNACGYIFSYGNSSSGYANSLPSGDGHNSPSIQLMKKSEDDNFKFVFSWIEGGRDKGWTTHFRPKHPPTSLLVQGALGFLKVKTFPECPFFDFDDCFWRFTPFGGGQSLLGGNADIAHYTFDALADNFSPGLENLIRAHTVMEPYGLGFLPVDQKANSRHEAELAQRMIKPAKSSQGLLTEDAYDVAISFAGTNREEAEVLATKVRDAGFNVFYDNFYPEQLWGKNLIEFFDEIYRKQSRYVVMFVSKDYVERMWTSHERQSAQARALTEKGAEYILPIRVDDTELPGAPPTLGYLSLNQYSIDRIADILIKKLRGV